MRDHRSTPESASAAEPTTVLVCATCRREGDDPEAPRAGARLAEALAAATADDPAIEIRPVECLSVCRRPVTVGLTAPGKWTYLYGDFPPDDADGLLAAARLYATAPDGLLPWKDRPTALKKGVVARLPPLAPPVASSGTDDR